MNESIIEFLRARYDEEDGWLLKKHPRLGVPGARR